MKQMYRNIIALTLLTFGACTVSAQETATTAKFYVCEGYDDEDYSLEKHADLQFNESRDSLMIGEDAFCIAEIDSITFTKPDFPSVDIHWNGESATVTVDPQVTGITFDVKGGHVNIKSTNLKEEILFVLSGQSPNGSLTISSDFKIRLNLNGVDLTSKKGAALDIECGKRVEVKLMKNTVNKFVDCQSGAQKAAFYCKGHMEIKGKGELEVTGNTKHALSSHEYLKFKQSTGKVTILGAVGDGIHCGKGNTETDQDFNPEHNYFVMNGGEVTISNCQSDCVDSDDYGSIFINGGKLTMNVNQTDGNGIAADSIFYMTGGEIVANVTGVISNGIRFNYDAEMSGGTIQCTVSGNGSKGIKAKRSTKTGDTVTRGGYAHFEGSDVDITVSGGTYVTDNSECIGIRVDRDLYQTDGHIAITVTNPQAVGLSARTDHFDGGTRDLK